MIVLVGILSALLAVAVGVIVVLVWRLGIVVPTTGADSEAADPEADPAGDASMPRLVAALDALSLGVVVADADEVVGFRNRSAQEILSSSTPDDRTGRALRDLLVGAVRGVAGEREIDLSANRRATYLIRAVPLPQSEGLGGGSVAVIEDITERRRTDQVRRDFVSNISHELKTPVGAVGLLAETLRDESDPETIRRFSERISLEVARLARTIDDLLELSTIEFGDDLFIDETAIGAVVDAAIGRFRAAAESRDISLGAAGDGSIVVPGDRRQLTSALGNLIDNAVKYSPDGGTVSVTMRLEGDAVAVIVADTGDGIPKRDLDRVFERFYRVDRARSRETGGTGLGLAIVRHVAHNHGGEVSVRSVVGRGTEFTLVLPLIRTAEEMATTDESLGTQR